ncbi:MAG TPA: DUF6058 family natural product biosynthesis protein [Aliidongia sp.]|uniref:DUF6058 family natural product biosynthesis protein n=1 Tax=Aliidongia sp. TaxID=1914230 RepID=UPI002DDD75BE|nr:DUF6058 family natural product biosynthesis protein [Aliidongia sp.]HEV2675919.1 DUF6058 family natural product biosynthesis protein [Aliidongia sp.]
MPLPLLARAHGWNLDSLHEAMERRAVPKPSYVLPDGTEMVSTDYFTLIGDGSDLGSLRDRFVARFEAALRRLGLPVAAENSVATWNSYLTGEFAACLKSVSPEAMALKELLIGSIADLVAEPQPQEEGWRAALRDAVGRLDDLEMPFAGWDEVRFGTRTSRARSIDDVHARFPEVFTQGLPR